MTFIHEDPSFAKLLAMVEASRNLDEPLVKKDYCSTDGLLPAAGRPAVNARFPMEGPGNRSQHACCER
jgi:hypothetical protein